MGYNFGLGRSYIYAVYLDFLTWLKEKMVETYLMTLFLKINDKMKCDNNIMV